MKSLEGVFGGLENSRRFQEEFFEMFSEDLIDLAKARGVEIKFIQLYGFWCKLVDLINLAKFTYRKRTDYNVPFFRVMMEITENNSAKFTLILLDEKKNLLVLKDDKYETIVYFMPTKEDLERHRGSFKEIGELPDEEPNRN